MEEINKNQKQENAKGCVEKVSNRLATVPRESLITSQDSPVYSPIWTAEEIEDWVTKKCLSKSHMNKNYYDKQFLDADEVKRIIEDEFETEAKDTDLEINFQNKKCKLLKRLGLK